MSHRRHLENLPEIKPRAQGPLEPETFGALAGTLDHLTLSAHDGTRPDNNHVYLWLNINHGIQGGRYECAFNTESDDKKERSQKKEVQYFVREEEIDPSEIPSPGFWSAEVSYERMGLKQADFTSIENGELRSLVYHYAEMANIIEAFGVTYKEGNGLHDIHMNSGEGGESTHKNHPGADGMLTFYFRHETGPSRKAWIFIKFSTQHFEQKDKKEPPREGNRRG